MKTITKLIIFLGNLKRMIENSIDKTETKTGIKFTKSGRRDAARDILNELLDVVNESVTKTTK